MDNRLYSYSAINNGKLGKELRGKREKPPGLRFSKYSTTDCGEKELTKGTFKVSKVMTTKTNNNLIHKKRIEILLKEPELRIKKANQEQLISELIGKTYNEYDFDDEGVHVMFYNALQLYKQSSSKDISKYEKLISNYFYFVNEDKMIHYYKVLKILEPIIQKIIQIRN